MILSRSSGPGLIAAGLLAMALFTPAGLAAPGTKPSDEAAGGSKKLPKPMRKAQITEKLDAKIPRDLAFRNAEGKRVRLGRYFTGERPVILNFAYFSCPMLCGLVRQALTDALGKIDLRPGEDYEVLTISVDPDDTPKDARAKKRSALDRLGKQGAKDGWHFLTAEDRKTVNALAKAVGWGYTYMEKKDEYAHSAAFVLATPDGRVSRYMYGLDYEPDTLRLSLVEASNGKVGSAWDKVVLFCCRYNPDAGGYTVVARNVMRAVGGLTVVVLGGGIGLALGLELLRRRCAAGVSRRGPA